MRSSLALLLAIVLVGCQSTRSTGPSGIDFDTEEDRYEPGADVRLQLENETDGMVGYNLCFSKLEQQTNGSWQPVPDPETVCTAIQHGLAAGDTTSYVKPLLAGLEEGTYRYRTDIEVRATGRRESITTDPFEVDG